MRLRCIALPIGSILLVLAAVAWLVLKYSPEVTLSFTQVQLQEQLDRRFPSKKCMLGACVELLNPHLALTDGSDRLEIVTAFVGTVGNRTMPGSAKFSGRPHYEHESGNFYLKDIQVTEFQMTGNAPDFNEVVKVRGPGIVAAIMNRFPIYSMQSHPKYGAIAKLALKRVSVKNGRLHVVFVNPLLLFGNQDAASRG